MSDALAPLPPISERIWDAKYRLKAADGAPVDRSVAATWRRVAEAGAVAGRRRGRTRWAARFHDALEGFAFLPAGRILAGIRLGEARKGKDKSPASPMSGQYVRRDDQNEVYLVGSPVSITVTPESWIDVNLINILPV